MKRLAIALAASAVMFTGSALAADVTLKVAHGAPETMHMHKAWEKFKELVETRTEGDIEVEIYPAGQLGEGRELLEFVQMGEIDLNAEAVGVLSGWDDRFAATELPYTFANRDIARKVFDGEYGDWLAQEMEPIGFKSLGWWEIGIRHLTNSKKAVYTPEDVDGLKLRTMQVDAHIKAWDQLGANPTPMASGEVYSALQQGIIDAQENPLGNIQSMRTHEVNKYISLTNHVYSAYAVVMNPDKFNSLSEEHQKIVADAISEASDYQQQIIRTEEPKLVDWFRSQGNEVNELSAEQMAVFQNEIKALKPDFERMVGADTYKRLMDAVAKAEAS
ncbi:TRAP transporter substrate-binding protein [Rhodobacteraceae bacterium RKSG542]|uniref:TRAP transporter substrate-binding protein n=1 Tax=Pseudovibrio flavus TaxID=2529854 RepID=UPI0012BCCED5|nr:TRAP transporter substrate-binding protein [Pseudovibrio flavus]MTI17421.1 TRAP transporter substrate-binding protein [Pseudovibrio flavus]